jgi:hypothetical protein
MTIRIPGQFRPPMVRRWGVTRRMLFVGCCMCIVVWVLERALQLAEVHRLVGFHPILLIFAKKRIPRAQEFVLWRLVVDSVDL